MISAMTLDDRSGSAVALLDDSLGRAVVGAQGLVGSASPRGSRRVRPQAHGGIDNTRFTDGALIDLTLEASSNVSVEAALTTFRTMCKPFTDTLDYDAASLLKWTEDESGLDLQRYVRLASDMSPPIQGHAAMLTWQAQLFAEDPRAFAQTATSEDSTALSASGGGRVYPRTVPRLYSTSGGGTATIANVGTRPSPPVFEVFGAVTNPQIVVVGGTGRIVMEGEVAAGDWLEVDAYARTVRLNGETNRANFIVAASTVWFDLEGVSDSNPTGETNLQLIGSDFDGSALLRTTVRAAY